MFFKSEEAPRRRTDLPATPPSSKSAARGDNRSVITDDIRITGDLDGGGDLRIDGAVEGNIRCHGLTIGESGRVEGEIAADIVEIGGRFNGKITTRVLTLTHSAKVDGSLSVSESLAIEAGAHFEGHCQRTASVETGAARPPQMQVPKGENEPAHEAATDPQGAPADKKVVGF